MTAGLLRGLLGGTGDDVEAAAGDDGDGRPGDLGQRGGERGLAVWGVRRLVGELGERAGGVPRRLGGFVGLMGPERT